MVPLGDFDLEAEKQNNKGMFYTDKLNLDWSETAETVEYKETQDIKTQKYVSTIENDSKPYNLFEDINNRLFDN